MFTCVQSNATERAADSLKNRRLGEVKVSGTLHQRDLTNAAPAQTLTQKEMEERGVQQLSEAVRYMNGVTLRDYGGAGGLKTISIRGLGAQFTGVSYDGVPLSDVQTGQTDLQRYTLSGVRQISLLVGEGSDIFIAAREATMPSLLSISTWGAKRADEQLHLTAQGVIGSWGYTNPVLSVEKRWGRLSLNATADYVYAENNYPFTIYNITERVHKHRAHSMMNQGHAEAGLRYQFNDNHSLTAKAYYYDNDRQLPGVVRYYTSESGQMLRECTAFGQVNYRGRLSSKWMLKGAAKWTFASSDYRDKLQATEVIDAKYWQREGYLSGAVLWKPAEVLSLSYASDVVLNNLNSHRFNMTDQHPRRTALLNTLSARWNRGFLTATGRVLHSAYINHVSTGAEGRDYHRWCPSASVSAKIGRGWVARVMWKEIFRMPSFSELYYYHLGTQDLKPERTNQWNAGLTWQGDLNKSLSASLSADGYINKVKDKIVTIPYNLFVSRVINAAKADIVGADLAANIDWQVSRQHALALHANYSFIQAEDKSSAANNEYGQQLPYMPKHTASGSVVWYNPWANVSLTAYGVSRSWATASHADGTDIGGYGEVGATLFREFSIKGSHKLTASLNVSNLLNKQYEVIAAYPMPSRGWRVKLRWEW